MSDRESRKSEDGVREELSLRSRAEARARETASGDSESLSPEQVRGLIHDLRVHQIQLEMQNEELRRAQLALEASRSRYFDLYDLAPVGYLTVSVIGLITESNLRAASMLGVARASLIGQPLTRFIASDDQQVYYHWHKKLGAGPVPAVCELRIESDGGAESWVRLEATLADEDEPSFRATINDITETRTLQLNLAQADRMVAMGVLAAGVAHEINNPLTYVIGNLEEVAAELSRLETIVEPAVLAGLLERCAHAADGAARIKVIAQGLGHLSRVEEEPSMVDLNEAIEHAVSISASETKFRATVVKNLQSVPPVWASDGKLSQIFLNLLVNAAHSIEEGAADSNRITIRTWSDEETVFADVSDTGCGIPQEDQHKIFEPFFTTKSGERGTGLGLAISRGILLDMNADIRVDSEVGKGTRFTVRVPRGKAAASLSARAPRAVQPAQPVKGGRILLVDDEAFLRSAIPRMLRAHEVVAVSSGRELMELLQTDTAFDLVLCDLTMPEMSGVDIHAWLEQHLPELGKRLMFISGGVFTERNTRYLREHPELIRINKPFNTGDLTRLVEKAIAASRGGEALTSQLVD